MSAKVARLKLEVNIRGKVEYALTALTSCVSGCEACIEPTPVVGIREGIVLEDKQVIDYAIIRSASYSIETLVNNLLVFEGISNSKLTSSLAIK